MEQSCSQCSRTLPLKQFPIRISSLTPFTVCRDHAWYWSKKEHTIYDPNEPVTTIQDIKNNLIRRLKGTGDSHEQQVPTWVVLGSNKDKKQIVDSIADLKGWIPVYVRQRKSRAKASIAPDPIFNYQLAPPLAQPTPSSSSHTEPLPILRLTLAANDQLNRVSVSIKTEVPTLPGQPWSRDETLQTKPAKEKKPRIRKPKSAVSDAASAMPPSLPTTRPPLSAHSSTTSIFRRKATLQPPPDLIVAPVPASPGNIPDLIQVLSASLNDLPVEPAIIRKGPAPGSEPVPPPVLPTVSTSSTSIPISTVTTTSTAKRTKKHAVLSTVPLPPSTATQVLATPPRPTPHHVPLNFIRPLSSSTSNPNPAYDPTLSLSYNSQLQSPTFPLASTSKLSQQQQQSNWHHSGSGSHLAPLTLFQLLDSPFLSPPNIKDLPKYDHHHHHHQPHQHQYGQHQPNPNLASVRKSSRLAAHQAEDEVEEDGDLSEIGEEGEEEEEEEEEEYEDADLEEESDEDVRRAEQEDDELLSDLDEDLESDVEEGDTEGFIDDDEEFYGTEGWESEDYTENEEGGGEGSGDEGESGDESEENDEDWLGGFVKEQLVSGFGQDVDIGAAGEKEKVKGKGKAVVKSRTGAETGSLASTGPRTRNGKSSTSTLVVSPTRTTAPKIVPSKSSNSNNNSPQLGTLIAGTRGSLTSGGGGRRVGPPIGPPSSPSAASRSRTTSARKRDASALVAAVGTVNDSASKRARIGRSGARSGGGNVAARGRATPRSEEVDELESGASGDE
ncbi:hypothetical protein T439DRAFT_320471 [Meredithblackwellia eburnea MCA 4105]